MSVVILSIVFVPYSWYQWINESINQLVSSNQAHLWLPSFCWLFRVRSRRIRDSHRPCTHMRREPVNPLLICPILLTCHCFYWSGMSGIPYYVITDVPQHNDLVAGYNSTQMAMLTWVSVWDIWLDLWHWMFMDICASVFSSYKWSVYKSFHFLPIILRLKFNVLILYP